MHALLAVNETLGSYGTKLRYAAVRVNLSLSTQELSYTVGLPVMHEWEEFINAQVPMTNNDIVSELVMKYCMYLFSASRNAGSASKCLPANGRHVALAHHSAGAG